MRLAARGPQETMMGSGKRLTNSFLVVLSLVVALGLCELAARAIHPASDIFPSNPARYPSCTFRPPAIPIRPRWPGLQQPNRSGRLHRSLYRRFSGLRSRHRQKICLSPTTSRLLHQPVYNLGLGGYGPVQYYQLLQESQNRHAKRRATAFWATICWTPLRAVRQDYWHWLRPSPTEAGQLSSIPLCTRPYSQLDIREPAERSRHHHP